MNIEKDINPQHLAFITPRSAHEFLSAKGDSKFDTRLINDMCTKDFKTLYTKIATSQGMDQQQSDDFADQCIIAQEARHPVHVSQLNNMLEEHIDKAVKNVAKRGFRLFEQDEVSPVYASIPYRIIHPDGIIEHMTSGAVSDDTKPDLPFFYIIHDFYTVKRTREPVRRIEIGEKDEINAVPVYEVVFSEFSESEEGEPPIDNQSSGSLEHQSLREEQKHNVSSESPREALRYRGSEESSEENLYNPRYMEEINTSSRPDQELELERLKYLRRMQPRLKEVGEFDSSSSSEGAATITAEAESYDIKRKFETDRVLNELQEELQDLLIREIQGEISQDEEDRILQINKEIEFIEHIRTAPPAGFEELEPGHEIHNVYSNANKDLITEIEYLTGLLENGEIDEEEYAERVEEIENTLEYAVSEYQERFYGDMPDVEWDDELYTLNLADLDEDEALKLKLTLNKYYTLIEEQQENKIIDDSVFSARFAALNRISAEIDQFANRRIQGKGGDSDYEVTPLKINPFELPSFLLYPLRDCEDIVVNLKTKMLEFKDTRGRDESIQLSDYIEMMMVTTQSEFYMNHSTWDVFSGCDELAYIFEKQASVWESYDDNDEQRFCSLFNTLDQQDRLIAVILALCRGLFISQESSNAQYTVATRDESGSLTTSPTIDAKINALEDLRRNTALESIVVENSDFVFFHKTYSTKFNFFGEIFNTRASHISHLHGLFMQRSLEIKYHDNALHSCILRDHRRLANQYYAYNQTQIKQFIEACRALFEVIQSQFRHKAHQFFASIYDETDSSVCAQTTLRDAFNAYDSGEFSGPMKALKQLPTLFKSLAYIYTSMLFLRLYIQQDRDAADELFEEYSTQVLNEDRLFTTLKNITEVLNYVSLMTSGIQMRENHVIKFGRELQESYELKHSASRVIQRIEKGEIMPVSIFNHDILTEDPEEFQSNDVFFKKSTSPCEIGYTQEYPFQSSKMSCVHTLEDVSKFFHASDNNIWVIYRPNGVLENVTYRQYKLFEIFLALHVGPYYQSMIIYEAFDGNRIRMEYSELETDDVDANPDGLDLLSRSTNLKYDIVRRIANQTPLYFDHRHLTSQAIVNRTSVYASEDVLELSEPERIKMVKKPLIEFREPFERAPEYLSEEYSASSQGENIDTGLRAEEIEPLPLEYDIKPRDGTTVRSRHILPSDERTTTKTHEIVKIRETGDQNPDDVGDRTSTKTYEVFKIPME